MAQFRGTLLERLEHYTDKSGDCWLWTGTQRNGYGLVYCGREWRQREAHIVTWELEHGGLGSAKGRIVRHTCDVPLCRRPSHLIIGTQADNMADMMRRGRACVGSARANAKLTEDQVVAIRYLLERGVKQRVIAEQFGITQPNVSYIKNHTWTHVP